MLRSPATRPASAAQPISSGIREVSVHAIPKPKASSARSCSLTEGRGGRYRDSQEREKELRQEAEALEAEAVKLEESTCRLHEEKKALIERQRQLDVREDELASLALALQPALKAVEEFYSGPEKGAYAAELDALLDARRDLSPVLEQERNRIREKVERDMADKLNRISQLEDALRAAHAQVDETPLSDTSPPIDIDEAIRQIAEQADRQIGVGLESSPDPDLFSTYIEKLDQILAGGIPEGSIILLNGPAGSMKTSLAYQVLHHAAARDHIKGMFFSLEQGRDTLIRQMERLGMRRNDSLDDLMVVDLVELRRSMKGQQGDWHSILMRYVTNVMREDPFRLFVLDSLESFMAMSERILSRGEVQDLFDGLRELGLTAIVISETPLKKLEDGEHMELYVADGAIELAMKETRNLRVQRWIRCVKLRGANIDTCYYRLLCQEGMFSISKPLAEYSSGI